MTLLRYDHNGGAVDRPALQLEVATVFATNPYKHRRGWPDITMWKDDQLRFVEVKAPGDSLGKSQKMIATNFAGPLGLDFSLVSVESPRT